MAGDWSGTKLKSRNIGIMEWMKRWNNGKE
jgi:hypothetical protein